MKRVVIASDNHFAKESIKYIKENIEADYYIHCGDSDMDEKELNGWYAVHGNHDEAFSSFPSEIILEIEGHRFLVVHGHKHKAFPLNYRGVIEYAKEKECDVLCFGHIHIYKDEYIDGIRVLNPGSLRYPRDGYNRTFMILEVDENEIKATKQIFKGGFF